MKRPLTLSGLESFFKGKVNSESQKDKKFYQFMHEATKIYRFTSKEDQPAIKLKEDENLILKFLININYTPENLGRILGAIIACKEELDDTKVPIIRYDKEGDTYAITVINKEEYEKQK